MRMIYSLTPAPLPEGERRRAKHTEFLPSPFGRGAGGGGAGGLYHALFMINMILKFVSKSFDKTDYRHSGGIT